MSLFLASMALPALVALGVAANDPGNFVLASARHPAAAQASFEGSPAWEKLDLRLRQAWQEAQQGTADADRPLECLLKASHPISADDKAVLAAAGYNARTVVGPIVTGSLKPAAVPEVASLPFVQVMELAAPMSLKKK